MGYRGMGSMGNGARGMGHIGNGSHGQWGTGVWAMRPTGGYRVQGYGPHGQWDA